MECIWRDRPEGSVKKIGIHSYISAGREKVRNEAHFKAGVAAGG
jgi:hypothetical protein